ncbi:MAG: OB-fold nucleic acid binding domain-containing protein [Halovenus sp.]
MSSCIICGSSADGRVCELHEEDVVFEFRGDRPEQLTPQRYYRGTVDGYAEFGVFVDIGDSVTGLLHKSELDQRLETLDLEPGDDVYVQVQSVRDNGNVDLGWSIRQDESRFRGALIDDPDADEVRLVDSGDGGDGPVRQTPDDERPAGGTAADESAGTAETADDDTDDASSQPLAAPVETTIDSLDGLVGDRVRIEGEVVTARQTSGPTVFELRDETGSVECAAFEEAGVRAYPAVDEGDIIRIEGEVERRRDELQVETEALAILEDDEREAVTERMRDALVERARPEAVAPLATDRAVESVTDEIQDAATAIRRAVFEGRPVVVRHAATADGYVGASALERATLPLIQAEHQSADAEYHYFDRRPLEGAVYDLDDATKDITSMLSNRERHGETLPLFVFVAAGGTAESLDGFDLLDIYDARRVVVDDGAIDEGVTDAVDVLVSPTDGGTTSTALATTVAAHVNDDVRADLDHLPAVSFWEDTPEAYLDLATGAGYDTDDVRKLREAVALEAYYQSYEDKRELISDLLFADQADDPLRLAGHVSEQFRKRMDTEVETAEANIERRDVGGQTVLVLDTDAYTHGYEFPPTPLLLDELYRRHRDEAAALVGVDRDEAYVRADSSLDVRDLAETARADVPGAALSARGARAGRVEFLAGQRDAVQKALLEALADELSPATI